MPSECVYGPYKHRRRWRIELAISDGGHRQKSYHSFATKEDAEEFKRALQREIFEGQDAQALRDKAAYFQDRADWYTKEANRRAGQGMTIAIALELYEAYLRDDKGNKPGSIATTITRLAKFLGDNESALISITERRAQAIYDNRRQHTKPDTHRNELSQAKTFMNWCIKRGWLQRNPFANVEPIGKRNRGKKQLRINETRRLVAAAMAEATRPDDQLAGRREAANREAALVVLIAIYLGLRASEITNIRPRDIDDYGRILWIPDSKTEAGRRTLEIPQALKHLLTEQAQRRPDRLFPHDRSWILNHVKRLCRLANVPEVTTHGLRGLHATLATQVGTTAHDVAQALGHRTPSVTIQHYIHSEASEQASRERLHSLLDREKTISRDPCKQGPVLH